MGTVDSLVKFESTLVRKEEVGAGTLAFHFTKPTHWDFEPGQFIDLTLTSSGPSGEEENTHAFSIASAPSEGDILVATRMRESAFKRGLAELPAGAKVAIQGPFGGFTLHADESRRAILLAGGIGITPARSIVVHAARAGLRHRIFLFYANRSVEDAAFLRELEGLGDIANLTVIPILTRADRAPRGWHGETGYITPELLRRYLDEPSGGIYYVSGPPRMVRGVTAALRAFGAANEDVRTDEFSGY